MTPLPPYAWNCIVRSAVSTIPAANAAAHIKSGEIRNHPSFEHQWRHHAELGKKLGVIGRLQTDIYRIHALSFPGTISCADVSLDGGDCQSKTSRAHQWIDQQQRGRASWRKAHRNPRPVAYAVRHPLDRSLNLIL